MYSSTNYVHYAQSQPNENVQSEPGGTPYTTLSPMNLFLSQPTMPQLTHLPPETQYDSQPRTGNPVPTSTPLNKQNNNGRQLAGNEAEKRKDKTF